jgi:hypothetical protein
MIVLVSLADPVDLPGAVLNPFKPALASRFEKSTIAARY